MTDRAMDLRRPLPGRFSMLWCSVWQRRPPIGQLGDRLVGPSSRWALRLAMASGVLIVSTGCISDFFTDPEQPNLVPAVLESVSVGGWSTNPGFTCGVVPGGTATCWGYLEFRESLRLRPSAASVVATPIAEELQFRSLSAGGTHACGVTVGGAVYCWGNNDLGQLGTDAGPTSNVPTVIPGLTLRSVDAGWWHTCGLSQDGTAYCWGVNFDGELGTVTTEVCDRPEGGLSNFFGGSRSCSRTPVQVTGGISFESVSAGGVAEQNHTCGVATDGDAYCWGSNRHGQLGSDGDLQFCGQCSFIPIMVSGGLKFNQVSAGFDHTCGVTTDEAVYCWGKNDQFQLGSDSIVELISFGDTTFVRVSGSTPIAVKGNVRFQSISAGSSYTCGVATDGTAYCWGLGNDGRLGTENLEESAADDCFIEFPNNPVPCRFARLPTPVSGTLAFASVAVHLQHTCGVTTEGSGYCWGLNNVGQLGNGTLVNSDTPVRVLQEAER